MSNFLQNIIVINTDIYKALDLDKFVSLVKLILGICAKKVTGLRERIFPKNSSLDHREYSPRLFRQSSSVRIAQNWFRVMLGQTTIIPTVSSIDLSIQVLIANF